jgi:hypothetical protein
VVVEETSYRLHRSDVVLDVLVLSAAIALVVGSAVTGSQAIFGALAFLAITAWCVQRKVWEAEITNGRIEWRTIAGARGSCAVAEITHVKRVPFMRGSWWVIVTVDVGPHGSTPTAASIRFARLWGYA